MRIYLCAVAMVLAGILIWQASEARSPAAGKNDPTPDQQAKALMEKYHKLSEKDQVGDKGNEIIGQLKGLRGTSAKSQEAIARLAASHNLRQIAIAVHEYQDKGGLPWFPLARPKWEYKVMMELDLLKLGKDNLAAGLNSLGEEGWELITGLVERDNARQFIFKRQK
jgi:hypothetical protein